MRWKSRTRPAVSHPCPRDCRSTGYQSCRSVRRRRTERGRSGRRGEPASRDNPAVDLTDGPNDPNDSNLNAQVRFGADAGAGEIIVLRPRGGLINHPDTLVIPLLVPDAPVVAWWPTTPPSNPAKDLMGAMARSRITDALHSNNPEATIERLRRNWTPEDIDLSWTRLTVWRAMLASMLDQPPHLPITAAKVTRQGRLPAYGNAVRMAASETRRTSRN